VLRDLRSPEGAFYTAEDADSPVPGGAPGEHAEGAYYVWTRGQVREVLGDDAEFFCQLYCVEETGNVPSHLDPQGELKGRNILIQGKPLAELAEEMKLTPQQANDRLVSCLERMAAARARRPRPHLDDKILAATNG